MSLSAADRLEIRELYARYAWAFDTGDVDSLVSLFEPDGMLELASRHEGRAAIRRLAEVAVLSDPWLPGSQHIHSQHHIDGAEDRAHVRTVVTRTHRLRGRNRANCSIVWTGQTDDVCVKRDGAWRFERYAATAWQVDAGRVAGRVTPLKGAL